MPTVPPRVRMRTNAAVLVAMSFSGIAACKPMSGVYGEVRELRQYKTTKSSIPGRGIRRLLRRRRGKAPSQPCTRRSARCQRMRDHTTYTLEVSSSIVIRPKPSIMTAHAIQTTGRQRPHRETMSPETIDMRAAEREKGSILKKIRQSAAYSKMS